MNRTGHMQMSVEIFINYQNLAFVCRKENSSSEGNVDEDWVSHVADENFYSGPYNKL